ncbi:alpha/beta fold hydrolase [Anaerobacillus sp. MEB173]|uniref:alpha/beta fold hydrolase n=1 Tax=Anaerobacillus sp. MEB173 TaxID=3383345 RepID=UPI003F90A4E7
MAYAYNNETPIYYETEGNGLPILFIHPPGMGHVTFTKQKELSRYFKVITCDLRGNGRSDYSGDAISMELIVSDLLAVINDAGVEKVVLCGYSNGGSIAQEFALSYPDRTSALILCGGFSEVNSFVLNSEFKLGILTTKAKFMGLLAKVLAKAHWKEKDLQKEHEDYMRCTNPEVLSKTYIEGLYYKSSNRLHELTIPILLVYGEREYYMHHYQDIFLKNVNDVEIVYVSKSLHQVPTKHYREFNHLLKDFIERKFAVTSG